MLVLVQYICHGLMAVVMYHHVSVSTCTVYLSWFDGCSYVSCGIIYKCNINDLYPRTYFWHCILARFFFRLTTEVASLTEIENPSINEGLSLELDREINYRAKWNRRLYLICTGDIYATIVC